MVKTGLILVTGATGFVGRALVQHLTERPETTVRAAKRSDGELGPDTNWAQMLSGVSTVVHTAARVHVMHDTALRPMAQYRLVNVEGTLNLARQAAAAGLRRFVFISSVKVNGETSVPGRPFFAHDEPAPQDDYGQSKLEAENDLRELALGTGMELVIIRPPLVYGPGVRANFLSLMRVVAKGIPLPLGSVNNQRSLLALDNLIDFIDVCIHHPDAANQIFLVSDGQDLSTTDLVRGLARAMGKSARLIPMPVRLLQLGATLLGRRDAIQRLCGNLQLDIGKARNVLDWQPPLTVDEGLRRAVLGLSE